VIKRELAPRDSADDLMEQIGKIPEFELLRVSTERTGAYCAQPKFKGVVERGRDEAVAIVSDKYSLCQMRDVFGRVLANLGEEVSGEVLYFNGRGQLYLFPRGQNVGICVTNSVDRSAAIRVSFVRKEGPATVHLPRTVCEDVTEYKRLHVGVPLNEVVNFSKVLTDAKETWGTIVDRLSKVPLTADRIKDFRESVDTKTLVEAVNQFANNMDKYLDRKSTLWDLLLAVLKTAAASKFKSDIHREERQRELSNILLVQALKES